MSYTPFPLVSVCIPTYNRAAMVYEAVKSALNQTYPNIEVVVSDDASIDDTVEKLRGIADSRIVIHTKKLSSGMVDNWNVCLRKANGIFIKYLASDDLLMPTSVEKMVVASYDHKVGFVCCARTVINQDGKRKKILRYAKQNKIIEGEKWVRQFLRSRRNTLGEPSAVLFRQSLIQQVGYFDPKFKQTVDAEYWLRLLLHTNGYYLNKPLCKFRIHDTGNSSKAAANGWNVDDAFCLVSKYAGYQDNRLQISSKKQRYQIAISVQRDIKKHFRKGNKKMAGILLRRLQHNLSFGEQVEFLIRHGLSYWWRRWIR